MKKMIKSIALCSSLVAALTACSEQKKTTEKVTVKVNEQMDATDLTDAGEQLVSPYTLHLADKAFSLALEKNPNDKKAEFYHTFLKRFMVFKGIATRLKPVIAKNGNQAELDKTLSQFDKNLRNFLTVADGSAAEIKNEQDLQNLLIDYRTALQEFRTFVQKNPDLQLDLHMNPFVFQNQIQDRVIDTCTVIEGSTDSETTLECNLDQAASVKVNIADLMTLKQEAAGEILYLTLYTSYNLNGVVNYAKKIESQPEMTQQQRMDLISSSVDLKLLPKEGLTAIRSIMTDLGVAAKWAMKYQESICPKNQDGTVRNRKGYLFAKGMCVEDASKLEKDLALLEQILKGPMKIDMNQDSEVKQSLNMNFMALLDRPVKDLRNLMPASWSADGSKVTSLKDNSFGGLLVDGNAQQLLDQANTAK